MIDVYDMAVYQRVEIAKMFLWYISYCLNARLFYFVYSYFDVSLFSLIIRDERLQCKLDFP